LVLRARTGPQLNSLALYHFNKLTAVNYRYIQIYRVRGVAFRADDPDPLRLLSGDVNISLSASPDQLLLDVDRKTAVANMLLDGTFGGREGPLLQRLPAALEEVRNHRNQEFGTGPFLILSAEGSVDEFVPSHLRRLDEFAVCFDAVKKGTISGLWKGRFEAAMVSLALAADSFLGVDRVGESVIYYEGDFPIFSYSFEGSASAYVSSPIADRVSEDLSLYYNAVAGDPAFERSAALLNVAFEHQNDPLRAFLFAWTSLEILVNKVFRGYETRFFEHVSKEGRDAAALERFVERVRDVMRDKYRNSDKLALIASMAEPSEGDAIWQEFSRLKAIRDDLTHGQILDAKTLPAHDIARLARRCMTAHLKAKRGS
jgi:hypothetical protein